MEINWLVENAEFPEVISPNIINKWLPLIAANHGKELGTLNYILTDDEGILRVNREFLQHDYYTDIITFDYSKRRMVNGDIYISLDTVATNAEQYGQDPILELHRVIAHGLLHLCGINDKGPGERQVMEQHENESLIQLREIINAL